MYHDMLILSFSRSCWNDKCQLIRAEFDSVLRNFFSYFLSYQKQINKRGKLSCMRAKFYLTFYRIHWNKLTGFKSHEGAREEDEEEREKDGQNQLIVEKKTVKES